MGSKLNISLHSQTTYLVTKQSWCALLLMGGLGTLLWTKKEKKTNKNKSVGNSLPFCCCPWIVKELGLTLWLSLLQSTALMQRDESRLFSSLAFSSSHALRNHRCKLQHYDVMLQGSLSFQLYHLFLPLWSLAHSFQCSWQWHWQHLWTRGVRKTFGSVKLDHWQNFPCRNCLPIEPCDTKQGRYSSCNHTTDNATPSISSSLHFPQAVTTHPHLVWAIPKQTSVVGYCTLEAY